MRLLIYIALLIPLKINAQQFNWRANTPSLAFTFVGGLSDGVRDASLFHFWDANNWWNGQESWKNKYADYPNDMSSAYWGSKTILVWTTDAPHLFNMITHQMNSFAMATYYPSPNRKFKHIVRDAVIYNVTRQAGQTLMYGLILK